MLARWLRRTAKHAARADPLNWRREALLCDRVESVRDRLLEIAWLLENSTDPDPGAVAELHKLLKDGCESPSTTATSTSPNHPRRCITSAQRSRPASTAAASGPSPSTIERVWRHTMTPPFGAKPCPAWNAGVSQLTVWTMRSGLARAPFYLIQKRRSSAPVGRHRSPPTAQLPSTAGCRSLG